MTSQDVPKDFPGTEHYRERIELFEQVLEKKKPNDLLADAQIMVGWMRTQCDHIEDLEKQKEQAWERAALEARRVLKNGSKARKLEKQVEEQDKEIERLREVLVHADSNLSLIRHRGYVEWGKGIPETWEIDQTIGRIRRASEGKP